MLILNFWTHESHIDKLCRKIYFNVCSLHFQLQCQVILLDEAVHIPYMIAWMRCFLPDKSLFNFYSLVQILFFFCRTPTLRNKIHSSFSKQTFYGKYFCGNKTSLILILLLLQLFYNLVSVLNDLTVNTLLTSSHIKQIRLYTINSSLAT